MLVSDLQGKDIINQNTGVNLGKIIDIDILDNGGINYFVIGSIKGFKKFTSSDYKVYFNDIKKIGEDVILVDFK